VTTQARRVTLWIVVAAVAVALLIALSLLSSGGAGGTGY
jgi:type VI protein secretion system component VasF